eukprot:997796-Rhodomonas_salina.3
MTIVTVPFVTHSKARRPEAGLVDDGVELVVERLARRVLEQDHRRAVRDRPQELLPVRELVVDLCLRARTCIRQWLTHPRV